ncbi:MAG TPA: diphosphomevalonate decarboxylase [Candidatus Bathyarchaeia archaeon]|nr:diphosphomevalonate decarboxylase [Candidatus Bathyarchaeia archaeon]
MKATAKAPANIALIKYWGKKDEALRIPENDNLSICLDRAFTVTTVEFRKGLKTDQIRLNNQPVQGRPKQRIEKHLERVRKKAKIKLKARVVSQNSFPTAAGLASSASGFAALTLAATKAAGLNLEEKDLTRLTRIASGSACRSIPSGFVYWQAGNSDQTSFAFSLYNPSYWDLRIISLIVEEGEKKVSSTKGHELAGKNPFLKARLDLVKENLKKIKKAFKNKDFSLLGEVIESETLSLHSVMLTSQPALIYWQPITLKLIHKTINWREEGLAESYFTIDAGPNLHLICRAKKIKKIVKKLKKVRGIKKIVVNKPAPGAHLLKTHLF